MIWFLKTKVAYVNLSFTVAYKEVSEDAGFIQITQLDHIFHTRYRSRMHHPKSTASSKALLDRISELLFTVKSKITLNENMLNMNMDKMAKGRAKK